MAIFNKPQRPTPKTTGETHEKESLNEYGQVGNIQLYNFIQGIRMIDSNYINNDILLERMCEDSIISAAIDIWTEDTLQVDPYTKEIFTVELESPDDKSEARLAKGLAKELDRFLKDDLQMYKQLPGIIKRIIKYGNAPIRLDFIDTLEDSQLELTESNNNIYGEISDKAKELLKDNNTITREAQIKNEVDWEYLTENADYVNSKSFEILKESINNGNKAKLLKENVNLNEEQLNLKRMVKGRWYCEILGHGTNIYKLSAKGKDIAYLDRDNPDKFLNGKNMVYFTNDTGKHKVLFEVGNNQFESADKKRYFQIERGESFLENAQVAWQILSVLEDILLLTRMTRSILYRIFSVEVGSKGNKETRDLLDRLKNKIKMDETVNVRDKIYNSNLSTVPLGDSIFIPTRNGIGVIDVKTVGGDVNLKDAIDLDYFKDKLFAALRIPKAYMSFESDLPGGLGNTTLTRMDIRYSRTVRRIQNIISEGLKDLCWLYLKMTRTPEALLEIPKIKIVFTSINSAEDAERTETKKVQMETLDRIISTLESLGVTINDDTYPETRDMLIQEFLGSRYLDSIKKDEKNQPVNPTDDDSNIRHHAPSHIPGDRTPPPLMDFDTEDSDEEDISQDDKDELEDDSNNDEINNNNDTLETPENELGDNSDNAPDDLSRDLK